MNLLNLLDAPGEQVFLTDLRSNTSYSYNDLYKTSVILSRFLDKKSVVSGDKIVYFTINSPFFFPLLFACADRKAALVPLSPQMHMDELNNIVKQLSPKVIFYDDKYTALDGAFKNHQMIPVKNNAMLGAVNDLDKYEAVDPLVLDQESDGKTALIIYTSGTTTNSKGVLLTHKNLYAMAKNISGFYGFKEGQRFLSMLPFYHINAPMLTGLACMSTKAHVFMGDVYGFEIARGIWDIVEQHKIQTLSITPSIMASLNEMYPNGAEKELPSLEYALVGTAHLKENIWRKFEELFHIPCYQGYGLTETTAWATMTPQDDRKRYDAAGIPVGCEVRIAFNDLSHSDSIPKGSGEVLIKGDIVMKGYWANPDATKAVLYDGWLKTGDVGFIDKDGQLVITGRIKNIIKRKGQLIAAENIDGVMAKHPSISESCTVGIPDNMLGEKVVTACVLKGPSEKIESELYDFARKNLSAESTPDEFVIFKQLPKNNLGKLNIRMVKEYVTGHTAQEIFNVFDKAKFRKARTPDKEEIIRIIQSCLLGGMPFYFTGYWGVGQRDHSNEHDRKVLDNLVMLINEVNHHVPKPIARVKFIIANLHGRSNFIPEDSAGKYFKAMEKEFQERGFEYIYLSEIWDQNGLVFENILEQLDKGHFKESWDQFILKDQFIKQAARRAHVDAEKGAQRYFAVATSEREAVARYCRQDETIFFTHNDLEYKIVHPDLPTIYIHSIKSGVSDKPWFMDSANAV